MSRPFFVDGLASTPPCSAARDAVSRFADRRWITVGTPRHLGWSLAVVGCLVITANARAQSQSPLDVSRCDNVLAVTMGEERPIAKSIATPWQLMSFGRRVYPVSDG